MTIATIYCSVHIFNITSAEEKNEDGKWKTKKIENNTNEIENSEAV